jgi:hypothetical protein
LFNVAVLQQQVAATAHVRAEWGALSYSDLSQSFSFLVSIGIRFKNRVEAAGGPAIRMAIPGQYAKHQAIGSFCGGTRRSRWRCSRTLSNARGGGLGGATATGYHAPTARDARTRIVAFLRRHLIDAPSG